MVNPTMAQQIFVLFDFWPYSFLSLCMDDLILKKNFMALFYGCVSTASRLQSHFEEAVYFLPLSFQKFLVINLSTSKR